VRCHSGELCMRRGQSRAGQLQLAHPLVGTRASPVLHARCSHCTSALHPTARRACAVAVVFSAHLVDGGCRVPGGGGCEEWRQECSSVWQSAPSPVQWSCDDPAMIRPCANCTACVLPMQCLEPSLASDGEPSWLLSVSWHHWGGCTRCGGRGVELACCSCCATLLASVSHGVWSNACCNCRMVLVLMLPTGDACRVRQMLLAPAARTWSHGSSAASPT
jgi:hypothetical protein